MQYKETVSKDFGRFCREVLPAWKEFLGNRSNRVTIEGKICGPQLAQEKLRVALNQLDWQNLSDQQLREIEDMLLPLRIGLVHAEFNIPEVEDIIFPVDDNSEEPEIDIKMMVVRAFLQKTSEVFRQRSK